MLAEPVPQALALALALAVQARASVVQALVEGRVQPQPQQLLQALEAVFLFLAEVVVPEEGAVVAARAFSEVSSAVVEPAPL